MKYEYIKTDGITNLERLEGTDRWYWGTDYASGDLYEAEELFRSGHEINKNRLIFVSYPQGQIYEPVKAKQGQYLGRPVCYQKEIFWLVVDFPEHKILIYKCSADMDKAEIYVKRSLDEVKDCYNLMLVTEPLTLCRQGHENRFQIVWPQKGDFCIDSRESLYLRDKDKLIFSKWYEDCGYYEETIVRKYPTGEVLEKYDGTFMAMPDGQKWMLK